MPPPAETLAARLKDIAAEVAIIGPQALAERHPGEHPGNFGAGVMALPTSTEMVAEIVRFCASEMIGVVPQGGRTGLVGGGISTPGELIVSTEKMTEIELIDPATRIAIVQAGVTLQALQEAAAPYGLTPGIDLAARGSATIAGMVSTNAGGILAFRNGVMRHQVLGLEAVLPDGTVFSDLTEVVKVSAGPDMKQMFIGAEGALGIVTRIVLRLETLRTARATALVGVKDAATALAVVGHFRSQPALMLEGAELMWAQFIRDSASVHGFDLGWLDEGTAAVLLFEVSAETAELAAETLESGLETLWEELGLDGGIVARSLDQSRKFWELREDSDFIYRLHPGAPSFDVSIPPGELDTYVVALAARLRTIDPAWGAYVYGHIADGNLHISVTGANELTDADKERIEDAVYAGIRGLGGSFSAEHGAGLEKRRAYIAYGNAERRALAQALKRAIDPDNLFNRGKVPY
ncbi:FAD-binding oxidoreductase [Rhizobiaceae bacterium n13]|uniref:FAD-binding oxidoreductase n=1 Tax=Ferirhizobium litorale TaxID=2927786 RepID=A0AAE3Q8X5_9HYPH|nr:FAD-binding oxidoreductase [Fererhizobium litorale]MDI7861230.1 FAD-binding oxidoreductase [Fererhizobium litorale]MDI7921377.1 FAD-binding oxidoreductase [Fererhizobium litorale]